MTVSATLTIPEAAALLGISRNAAYATAASTGELAGVPVLRVGPRRLFLPRAPLESLLGIAAEPPPPSNDLDPLTS